MNRPIPKEIKELSIKRVNGFNRIIQTSRPQGFEVGQIWSTFQTLDVPDGRIFKTDEPRLVVILGVPVSSSDNAILNTAIISLDTHMASEYDLVLGEKESPLGFDFIIEVWNETPVFQGHLKRFLAKLPDDLIETLMDLYRAHVSDLDLSSELENWVGLRIFYESDLRLAFQEQEVDAASYLANASTAMLCFEEAKTEALELDRSYWTSSIIKTIQIKPILEKLRNYPSYPTGPAFAHASDTEGRNAWIVYNPNDDTCFKFELLCNRRRSPNPVYFYILDVSEKLSKCKSIISIVTPEIELRSGPTNLFKDMKVTVGEIQNFKYEDVEFVKLEIEEKCLGNG